MKYLLTLSLRAPNQITSAVFILIASQMLTSDQFVLFFTVLELGILLSIPLINSNDLTLSQYVKHKTTRKRSLNKISNYAYRFILTSVCVAAVWPLDIWNFTWKLFFLSFVIMMLISLLKLSTMMLRALNLGTYASLLDLSALYWLLLGYLLISLLFHIPINTFYLLCFYILNILILLLLHYLILGKNWIDSCKNILQNFSYEDRNLKITISQFCSQLIYISPIIFSPLIYNVETSAKIIITMKIGFLINSIFLVIYNLNQHKIIVSATHQLKSIMMRNEITLLLLFTTIFYFILLMYEALTVSEKLSIVYLGSLYITFGIKSVYGHLLNAAQMLGDKKISNNIFIFNCIAMVPLGLGVYSKIDIFSILIPLYSLFLIMIIKYHISRA